eukprot:scaffold867_cov317-Pavlova_lutheri.AAC.50
MTTVDHHDCTMGRLNRPTRGLGKERKRQSMKVWIGPHHWRNGRDGGTSEGSRGKHTYMSIHGTCSERARARHGPVGPNTYARRCL